MIKNPTTFIFGILLILTPFSGLPLFWKFFLVVAIGIVFCLSSLDSNVFQRQSKKPKRKENNISSGFMTDYSGGAIPKDDIDNSAPTEVINPAPVVKEKPKRVRKQVLKNVTSSSEASVDEILKV